MSNTSTRRPSQNRSGQRRQGRPDRRPALVATETATGTLRLATRGFGFIDIDGTDTSVFVPPPVVGRSCDGDRVRADVAVEADGRRSATAIELLERTRTVVFGVAASRGDRTVFVPDASTAAGTWLFAPDTTVRPGAGYLAAIGADGLRPVVSFDDPESGAALRQRVMARFGIAERNDPAVAAEAATLATAGLDNDPRRLDLTSMVTFTIDADYSRDLDDAISVAPAEADGAIRVWVHIADVASHVPAGSATDIAARTAATSVYLPDHVIPMLPRDLSEAALSLLPGVDRDAVSVEMRIAPDGEVVVADMHLTRIRSAMRLSYDTAADILTGARPADVPDTVVDALTWLRTAAARLSSARSRRGGFEARRVEPELTVTLVDGIAATCAAGAQNVAHELIERLMVAANEAVAGWMSSRGLPALYRVHAAPDADAAAHMEDFAAVAGIHLGLGGQLTPQALSALEAQLDRMDDPALGAVWDVLLGELGRAAYTPIKGGHFGLGSDGYVHFTSPLRRYADLCVHRIIGAYLRGQRDMGAYPSVAELAELAEHINTAAGAAARAEAANRKSLWAKVLADTDPNGETVHAGRVFGVAAKGLRISLDSSLVVGFLPYREVRGGRFDADELGHAATDGRRELRLGDPISVTVASADPATGEIELVEA